MRLSQDEIVALVRQEIEQAQGYDADVLGDERARALDFYYGNTESSTIPEAQAGRSNIVSMDVHDSVNSLMAEVLPMMQASSVEFPPLHELDEPTAQMESDLIARMLEESGFDEIAYSACHSALLQGLGWIKVEYKDKESIDRRIYDGDIDPIIIDSIQASGGTVTQNDDQVEVVQRSTQRKLVIDCVAPENIIFSPSRSQYELEDLRFIAERKVMTVNELVTKYGMSPVDASSIPDSQDDWYVANIARAGLYAETTNDTIGGYQDQSREKEVWCCYLDIAVDDEGPLEKYYLMIGGSFLIESYPVPFQPWISCSPIPMPHRIQGRGLYQTMQDVAQAKTDLLRNLIDNSTLANGSRVAYDSGRVNVRHLTNGRVNGVVAVNGSPMDAFRELSSGDITGTMITALQYLDEVRSSRGGSSLDMNDAELQTAKTSAEAAYNTKVSKEKMAGFYGRNLVNMLLKGAYLKVHRTLRTYFDTPIKAKVRGQWVDTVPSEWIPRDYAICNTGLTEVDRRQKIQNLTMLNAQLQQINAGGGGGIITDVKKIYNGIADWIRYANIGNVEEYLIDPESEESKQVQQQRSREANQQMSQAQQMMQLKQAMEEMKLEVDKYKHDTEIKFKYWKEGLEYEENREDNQTQIQIAGQRDRDAKETPGTNKAPASNG